MTPERLSPDCERIHPTLAVSDILAAVEFYTHRFGFLLDFVAGEPPDFAALSLDKVQLFLTKGRPAPEGCSVYYVVGNADELCDFHRKHNVEIVEPPGDRPYGLRDYTALDLHGYRHNFGHYIYTVGTPIVIERVDVPVRLEKRLAALLHDLARYKRMSLTSCLEEILLHTNEPFGDGVASPHTPRDLRYIQELKTKHGIDYDSHASYRFTEKSPD